MKKIYSLLTLLLVGITAIAQTITVSGGCINAPVTLNSTAPVNGMPAYVGTGIINTPQGPVTAQIDIHWEGAPDNVWVLAYDGGPYYANACQTAIPPGTANPSCSWTTAQTAPCTSPAALSITGNVALSVAFGSISAFVQDDALHVKWRTETETNNDHFDIEASKDGKEFTTIATVQSKADNGNSQTALDYEWISDHAISFTLIPLLAIAAGLFGAARRKKAAVLALAGGLMLITNLYCNKHKDTVAAKGTYFIRIAQIDKDGTKSYSKTIKVNL